MTELFSRFMDLKGGYTSVKFSMAPVIPLYWILVIVFIMLFIVFYSYATNPRSRVPFSKRLSIGLLRVLFILVAASIMLGPKAELQKIEKVKPAMLVLADNSQSMSILSEGMKETRYGRAKDIVEALAAEKSLNDKYNMRYFLFSDNVMKTVPEFILKQSGPVGLRTGITDSLYEAVESEKAESIDSIILISDGAENSSAGPADAGDIIVPVHTIELGRSENFTDAGIGQVYASDFAFKNTAAKIELDVFWDNIPSGEFPVYMKENDNIIKIEKVKASSRKGEAKISFQVIPKKLGNVQYTFEIPGQKRETIRENNIKKINIEIIRDKLRVFLMCGRPSWEYRFLRYFLKQNPGIDLVSLCILRSANDVNPYDENELSLIPFPAEEMFGKEIFDFDLVIFDNFPRALYIPAAYQPLLDNIVKYVESGGAFIMMGGENSFGPGGWANTSFEKIIPFYMKGPSDRQINDNFNLRLTRDGQQHPIMRLHPDAGENMRLWERLASLEGCNEVFGIKKWAIPLAEHPYYKNDSGNVPVIAIGEVKKGRVMALTSDSTWRWNFMMVGEGLGNQYYFKFWDNAFKWLLKSPELRQLILAADRKNYLTGEMARLSVKAYDKFYRPQYLDKLEITVILPSGASDKILAIPEGWDKGVYDATCQLNEPGIYRITAKGYMSGELSGTDEKIITVSPSNIEFMNASANEKLLSGISESTGGRYFSSYNDMIGYLGKQKQKDRVKVVEARRLLLWDRKSLLLLLAVLLALEWILRKRAGLI